MSTESSGGGRDPHNLFAYVNDAVWWSRAVGLFMAIAIVCFSEGFTLGLCVFGLAMLVCLWFENRAVRESVRNSLEHIGGTTPLGGDDAL